MADDPKKLQETEDGAAVIDTSKMSEGQRAALEMAESSRESFWEYPTFAGALFMGQLPYDLVYPFPEKPEDRSDKGDKFLADLEAFLRDHVDPDEIDRTGEIPDEVIDGLGRLGAFGIKVPTKYGGLGLTQYYYSQAAILLGSYCGNTTALLSAHQSIGVPNPLLQFGTEEQKLKYLPRVSTNELSAFALTEEGVGSDPARMATTAEPTPDGKGFVINGRKLWCTNGTRAGVIIVMARTPPKVVKGRSRDQVTAFIVDTDTPGVEVVHRCRFMGLHALFNAVMEFHDVYVPRENIVLGEGKGLRVALTTLNTGRLTLPAGCLGGAKRALEATLAWSNERVQWGAPIGKHAAIADKIANMSSTIFALEAMTRLTSLLVDRKKTDIRLEAAMCKMWGSEMLWRIIDDAMQVVGGRGYETDASLVARGEKPRGIERGMRDARINLIFEGSSEIMRLFIAREALDPHLKAAGEIVNSQVPLGRKAKAAGKAGGFYARWYPAQWIPFGGPSLSGMEPAARRHVRYVARTSRKLGRRLFHAMVKVGPKLEREQVLLARFVEIGTELFAQAASASYAQHLIDKGRDRKEVLQLLDHFCAGSRLRIDRCFEGIARNNDRNGYRLAQDLLEGSSAWLQDGIVRVQGRKPRPEKQHVARSA